MRHFYFLDYLENLALHWASKGKFKIISFGLDKDQGIIFIVKKTLNIETERGSFFIECPIIKIWGSICETGYNIFGWENLLVDQIKFIGPVKVTQTSISNEFIRIYNTHLGFE